MVSHLTIDPGEDILNETINIDYCSCTSVQIVLQIYIEKSVHDQYETCTVKNGVSLWHLFGVSRDCPNMAPLGCLKYIMTPWGVRNINTLLVSHWHPIQIPYSKIIAIKFPLKEWNIEKS